ncbi:MAG: Hsp70 family protein [Erysipelotrichaceae bacterium]|nr:Hsp70 family protein [Erysipelotrichaceae bacterium]
MVTVGIDLGTTNTVVSIMENEKAHIVEIDQSSLMPSEFYYNKKKNIRQVGKIAKNRRLMDPENGIKSTKRTMDSLDKLYSASGESFSSQDIAVEILLKVKEAVNKYLEKEEELVAVITVPNNFSTSAVENTQQAGLRAGFHEVTILKEPIASVLAYGEAIKHDHATYFVSDFGGGTYDIAVIRYDGVDYEVLATGGNEHLGGDDFTNAMIDYINELIFNKEQFDFSADTIENNILLQSLFENNKIYQRAKARIAEKAEHTKIVLSHQSEEDIEILKLFMRNDEIVNFDYHITAKEFENYPKTQRLLGSFRKSIEDVITKLERQNLSINDIDYIIYAGGSMNIPQVQNIVKELLPNKTILDNNLDTIVAIGASCYDGNHIKPRINYNLGLRVDETKMSVIIPEQSQYPIQQSKVYTTIEDNQTAVDFEAYEGNVKDNIYDQSNHYLGTLHISGITPQKAGKPVIQVTFSLTKEGILEIVAVDQLTNEKYSTELKIK